MVRLLAPEGRVRLSIAAIGDVAEIGRARSAAAPLAALAPALSAADLAFANVEMPVGDPARVRAGRSREFHQSAAAIARLAAAGVRVASLANNHVFDCGPRGVMDTIAACAAAGIATAGAGATRAEARRPAIVTVAGQRVAVHAWAAPGEGIATERRPGYAPFVEDEVREDLARSRADAEVRIASVHWGSMYVDEPPPRVRAAARVLAACGADLVLGHHPHVLQGFERIGGTLVLYSLGDALFDPAAGDVEAAVASEVRRDSGVFTARLAERHGLDWSPIELGPDGIPAAATPAGTERMRARLEALSQALAAGPGDAWSPESASRLLRYELDSLGAHLRAGRFDRALRLLAALRPRHARTVWAALRRRRRTPGA